ncbi:MAG TPA: ATP-binding protein [Kofleriaceae bacterium]
MRPAKRPDIAPAAPPAPPAYNRGLEQLVRVVQELGMVRELAAIAAIVPRAARELTCADGASFVLREADHCYHAGEDAIAPLWNGRRLPLDRCISGWAMQHRKVIVLGDVRTDDRVPAEVYRSTFVHGLAMVPIGPMAAIGVYWATRHHATADEIRLLQALADATVTAMANIELWDGLEARVAERTAQLEDANRELEALSSAVSHDLRAPLRAIAGFSQILLEDHGTALGAGRQHLDRIRAATGRMTGLVDDLLRFSRMAASEVGRRPFDLARLAREIVDEIRAADPERKVEIAIPAALPAQGDERLVRVVLENLVRNAWKFTGKREAARIEIGAHGGAFFVRDNGAGFDLARADKLFTLFHRLHSPDDFEGTGAGLAIAQRIVHRHGGRIWAEGAPDRGATFYFTLG